MPSSTRHRVYTTSVDLRHKISVNLRSMRSLALASSETKKPSLFGGKRLGGMCAFSARHWEGTSVAGAFNQLGELVFTERYLA